MAATVQPMKIVRFMKVEDIFREASWEEAMELAAGGLKKISDERGGSALAGFGSAKGSNEEAYLFQCGVSAIYRLDEVGLHDCHWCTTCAKSPGRCDISQTSCQAG